MWIVMKFFYFCISNPKLTLKYSVSIVTLSEYSLCYIQRCYSLTENVLKRLLKIL